jgi:plastocyanin
MKKIGVIFFVFVLLAAGSYYFFLNYPTTAYTILGINHSANSTPAIQINSSEILNITPINITTSTISNITPINITTSTIASSFSTYEVIIADYELSPLNLVIHKGDTVRWTNQEGIVHHLVSDKENEIDSSFLYPGQSYSHSFTNKGTFSYHCYLHQSLSGTVIVE